MKNTIVNVSLFGMPLDLGAENLGVDVAPKILRKRGITNKLKSSGLEILDKGDIEVFKKDNLKVGNKNLKYLDEIIRVSNEIARKVDLAILEKNKVLAIGGDHAISLGTISGASSALKGDLGVIYIDTHGDINTDKTTLSGNIHGMHVASILGFGEKKLIDIYKRGKKVKKENIILAGGNDFDLEEKKLIQKEKIKAFTITDLLAKGLDPLFKMIDDLNKKVNNIWVSLDLDAIDCVYAPGVGIPNTGGLTYREVSVISRYIGKNCNVVGVDLEEYNKLKDIDNKTAELSIELCAKIFGRDYSPYTKYMDKNKL